MYSSQLHSNQPSVLVNTSVAVSIALSSVVELEFLTVFSQNELSKQTVDIRPCRYYSVSLEQVTPWFTFMPEIRQHSVQERGEILKNILELILYLTIEFSASILLKNEANKLMMEYSKRNIFQYIQRATDASLWQSRVDSVRSRAILGLDGLQPGTLVRSCCILRS